MSIGVVGELPVAQKKDTSHQFLEVSLEALADWDLEEDEATQELIKFGMYDYRGKTADGREIKVRIYSDYSIRFAYSGTQPLSDKENEKLERIIKRLERAFPTAEFQSRVYFYDFGLRIAP
ncbi:MAG: hypothetical protein Q7Q73_17890 [Verrucomicrobiota bacterium JB024]|nr:hypothetical protein [Verrucomicrobiota bacterium JB024]